MDFKDFNKRLWSIVFLVLALLAVGYWGYNRYIVNQQLKSELNNRYEYAFQGVNNHIDALESELGALLISQSNNNISINLSNVWRSAYSAQEDIGQLPITSDALNNVKYLLEDVLKYTNHLDKKIATKKLTELERDMINKFYDQVCVVNTNLQDIHSQMDQENFTWYDKKRVKIDERDENYSATPLRSLMSLDDKIALDGVKKGLKNIISHYDRGNEKDMISSLSRLEVAVIDKKKAIKVAKNFIKDPKNYNYEIKEKKGIKLKAAQEAKIKVPTYEVKAVHKKNPEEIIYADVSKKGGKIVWLLKKREFGNKKISYEKAKKSALDFVSQNRYKNMRVKSYRSFNDFLIISLVPLKKDVLIKPNAVIAEVALDNGEVVGFNGLDYLLDTKEYSPEALKPNLNQKEAEKKVSPRLKLVKETRLVIDKIDGQNKLCYEFIGEIADGPRQNQYRVKINAKNGSEEEIKVAKGNIYRKQD